VRAAAEETLHPALREMGVRARARARLRARDRVRARVRVWVSKHTRYLVVV